MFSLGISSGDAIERNQQLEFERNMEKLQLMKVKFSKGKKVVHQTIDFFFVFKWSAAAFNGLSIVPPGISVCQQINFEYLSKLVLLEEDIDQQVTFIYPDAIIGTDAHTTLANGFGVLSYSKQNSMDENFSNRIVFFLDMGTIEAEASMFGQPIHIRLASVIIGCRLVGQPHFMSTSIDLISALMKVCREEFFCLR